MDAQKSDSLLNDGSLLFIFHPEQGNPLIKTMSHSIFTFINSPACELGGSN